VIVVQVRGEKNARRYGHQAEDAQRADGSGSENIEVPSVDEHACGNCDERKDGGVCSNERPSSVETMVKCPSKAHYYVAKPSHGKESNYRDAYSRARHFSRGEDKEHCDDPKRRQQVGEEDNAQSLKYQHLECLPDFGSAA
jgi:hypothetical protein